MIDLLAFASTFDISNIPGTVNTVLFGGGNLIAAQIICSVFVLMMVTLPMMLGSGKLGVVVIVDTLVLAGLTAIDWLPSYAYIVVLIVGIGFLARAGADAILG